MVKHEWFSIYAENNKEPIIYTRWKMHIRIYKKLPPNKIFRISEPANHLDYLLIRNSKIIASYDDEEKARYQTNLIRNSKVKKNNSSKQLEFKFEL